MYWKRLGTIVGRAKTLASVESILSNPDHPQFRAVWAEAMDRTAGKVAQPSTVDASVTLEVVMREEGARG